jgi:hypothetical protein
MLLIFKISLIQVTYDFLGWHNNHYPGWGEMLFRSVKFILDYPVTYCVLRFYNCPIDLIGAFFIAKQFGLCDMIYIIIELIVDKKPYPVTGLWWLWWSFPVGAWRTMILSLRNKTFIKGDMNIWEFILQTAVGVVIAFFILEFHLFTKMVQLFHI